MRIVQVNTLCGIGSTGRICLGIKSTVERVPGVYNDIMYFYGPNSNNGNKLSFALYEKGVALLSRITGKYGFLAHINSRKLVKNIKKVKPDIVHLHNIHDHSLDLACLFNYLNKSNIKVIWTFHDCWAFTGYCPHFVYPKCDKWRTECQHCIRAREFSWFFDNSNKLFAKKRKLFTQKELIIVTPSRWLADLVGESFLQKNLVKIINNGIDLSVFKPSESDFKKRYDINDEKYILLGVAFGWGVRKGLDVFVELSKRLNKDKYQIVLVGTDDNVDKQLPKDIISIHRTNNHQELVEIYSVADLFVNPTREENYPTVNMESIACGTPVLTFRTGGSPEILNEKTGAVVDCDDIDAMEQEIIRICTTKPYKIEDCIERAKAFDMNDRFQEYVDLYCESIK